MIRPTRKMQNFNWRRVLIAPQGAPNKNETIWDFVKEIQLNQEEVEEQFENKVLFVHVYSNFRKKRQLSVQGMLAR